MCSVGYLWSQEGACPSQDWAPDRILKGGFADLRWAMGGAIPFIFTVYLNTELMITPNNPANCLQLSLFICTSLTQTLKKLDPSTGQIMDLQPNHTVAECRVLGKKPAFQSDLSGVSFPHLWKKRLHYRKWKLMALPSAMIALWSLHLDIVYLAFYCYSKNC